ncbi:MAG: VOC family protein [Tissierellia bacterium]|nr:VOC family protein [Tissierellia bacterium]
MNSKKKENLQHPFKIGHVLFRVKDLHQAVKKYEDRGYQVLYGSNPKKARNGMIYFEDGSFLELFNVSSYSFMRKLIYGLAGFLCIFNKTIGGRYMRYAEDTEGWADWALDSEDDFETNLKRLSEREVELSKVKSMKRKNPDNILLRWKLVFPKKITLPFLMGEYEPKLTYSTKHKNGVKGIKEIHLGTKNLEESFNDYCKFFGTPISDYTFQINKDQVLILKESDENKLLDVVFKY